MIVDNEVPGIYLSVFVAGTTQGQERWAVGDVYNNGARTEFAFRAKYSGDKAKVGDSLLYFAPLDTVAISRIGCVTHFLIQRYRGEYTCFENKARSPYLTHVVKAIVEHAGEKA